MTNLASSNISIIGTGAIGGAVIDRLVDGLGVPAANILACDTDEEKRAGISERFGITVSHDPLATAKADLIVLAVPPPAVAGIIAAIGGELAHRPLVVSFAAALPMEFLSNLLPADTPVVRVNPNSPSLVGHGYNPVVFGSTLTDGDRGLADAFLTALGQSVEVPDESMNLYTGLTAVGPTYFLPVFDALIAMGTEQGLSERDAVAAAVETARGVAAMVDARGETPGSLRLYTGLRPLDHDAARDAVKAAAMDAYDRMKGVQAKVADG